MELKYLQGYKPELQQQIVDLIQANKLGKYLDKKYQKGSEISNEKTLYAYTMTIKQQFMKKSGPLSKVIFDPKISIENQALGLHSFVSRVQGKKLKAKNEIRIASVFRKIPEPLLRVIVVHELAHLKEKAHDKPFYKLCQHMEPNYFQLEFDMRLFLTFLELDKN
ncbi:MAG: M48 family metallopeptidase [Lentisphaeria bacterium]|nr:M48 family metallopeptidase [Lentisphaeria bacterium]